MNENHEDLYRSAMDGIAIKVAMQAIRKILRFGNEDDAKKLEQIVTVVHSYEKDAMGK